MLYKRGRMWWYCFIINGKRCRGSTKLSNKVAALHVEAEKRVEVAEGTQEIRTPSFGEAFSLFLSWVASHVKPRTHQRYQVSGKRLGAYFADLHLDKITPRDIESFKAVRGKGCSSVAVNREPACR